MSIRPDYWIQYKCEMSDMIVPFEPEQVKEVLDPIEDHYPVISFGLSSYGYDIRVSDKFWVMPRRETSLLIDPKNFNKSALYPVVGDCVIPPNSFALAETMERFKIPRDVLTLCVGKSTYARCGIIVNVTPFEPEWEGVATLEISNTTPYPAKIYANEGIAQVIFFQSPSFCVQSYADKKGKYQDAKGMEVAKV